MNIKPACLFALSFGSSLPKILGESDSNKESENHLRGVKSHKVSDGDYYQRMLEPTNTMRGYSSNVQVENDIWESCFVVQITNDEGISVIYDDCNFESGDDEVEQQVESIALT